MPLKLNGEINGEDRRVMRCSLFPEIDHMNRRTKKTELDKIKEKLRQRLSSETTNIWEIGQLLIKARQQLELEHGEWMPLLAQNFDLSYRTALRYIKVEEYRRQQNCHGGKFDKPFAKRSLCISGGRIQRGRRSSDPCGRLRRKAATASTSMRRTKLSSRWSARAGA